MDIRRLANVEVTLRLKLGCRGLDIYGEFQDQMDLTSCTGWPIIIGGEVIVIGRGNYGW